MVTEQISSFVSARFLVLFRAEVIVGGVNKFEHETFALDFLDCGLFWSVIVDADWNKIDFLDNFLP